MWSGMSDGRLEPFASSPNSAVYISERESESFVAKPKKTRVTALRKNRFDVKSRLWLKLSRHGAHFGFVWGMRVLTNREAIKSDVNNDS